MIGVFDSGHGGLTVLAALTRRLPGRSFVYLGDHAHAPYGNRPAEEIYELTLAGVERLFDLGCPLVVLACNTAAAIGLRRLQQTWLPRAYPGRRVLGVVVPVIEAVTGRPWQHEAASGPAAAPLAARRTVALFATRHTVESGAFPHEVAKRAPEIDIVQQACPRLVTLIEAGAPPAELDAAVADYAAQLTARLAGRRPESVILGCTHYPLVADLFAAHLPPGVPILSQPRVTAESLARYLDRHPAFDTAGGPAEPVFYTSGDPVKAGRAAGAFLRRPVRFQALPAGMPKNF